MITLYIRGVVALSRLCGVASASMILFGVIIVCQMVFVRYVLHESTVWQTPAVTFLLVAATFIGAPYVLLKRGHVNVDILPLFLPRSWARSLSAISILLSLAFCAVIAWYSAGFWHEVWTKNWQSSTSWRVPLWLPYLSLPLGFAVLCLQCIADLLGIVTGRDKPFGLCSEDKP
jgi:TRAP-type C4-dicarboxylate transport system permease small subunit